MDFFIRPRSSREHFRFGNLWLRILGRSTRRRAKYNRLDGMLEFKEGVWYPTMGAQADGPDTLSLGNLNDQ